jgi:hypothetical protein
MTSTSKPSVQRCSAPGWSSSKDSRKDFLHAGHTTQ